MKMTKSEKCQFYPYLGGWKDKQGATDMSNPHPAVPRPKNNQIQPFVSKIGCCKGQGDAVKIEKEKGFLAPIPSNDSFETIFLDDGSLPQF